MKPSLFQAIFALMIMFMLFRFLGSSPFGRFILWSILILAALAALVIWMNRCRPEQLRKIYAKPGARKFIDVVCSIANEQPPLEPDHPGQDGDEETPNLMLQQPGDFAILRDHINDHVYGFDTVVPDMVDRLKRKLEIRKTAKVDEFLRPLGSFLVAAPVSSGRRFLAEHFALGVYRKGTSFYYNLRDYADAGSVAAIAGSSAEKTSILARVIRYPQATFILENVSAAHERVLEFLELIFTRGAATDGARGTTVRFQDALFFLIEPVNRDDEKAEREKAMAVGAEDLAGMVRLSDGLLSSIDCLYLSRGASLEASARVLMTLMRAEASRHEVHVEYLDPEVIADGARRFAANGFATAPAWVSQVLEEPLHDARSRGASTVRVEKKPAELVASVQG